MKCEPSEDDPFSFEGPEIFKCKGSTINWKEGKNLTVKTVKKKQKHKSKGNVRTITKQVKNDSFFNFFDPPPIPDDPDADVDPETQDLLTADFEIGHYIRDRIIPRAVLFFTGNYQLQDNPGYQVFKNVKKFTKGEKFRQSLLAAQMSLQFDEYFDRKIIADFLSFRNDNLSRLDIFPF